MTDSDKLTITPVPPIVPTAEELHWFGSGLIRSRLMTRKEAAEIYGDAVQDDFDRHAALAIGSCYKSADKRA